MTWCLKILTFHGLRMVRSIHHTATDQGSTSQSSSNFSRFGGLGVGIGRPNAEIESRPSDAAMMKTSRSVTLKQYGSPSLLSDAASFFDGTTLKRDYSPSRYASSRDSDLTVERGEDRPKFIGSRKVRATDPQPLSNSGPQNQPTFVASNLQARRRRLLSDSSSSSLASVSRTQTSIVSSPTSASGSTVLTESKRFSRLTLLTRPISEPVTGNSRSSSRTSKESAKRRLHEDKGGADQTPRSSREDVRMGLNKMEILSGKPSETDERQRADLKKLSTSIRKSVSAGLAPDFCTKNGGSQAFVPHLKSSQSSLLQLAKSERHFGSISSLVGEDSHRLRYHLEIQHLLKSPVPKRSESLQFLLEKRPTEPRALVGLDNLGNTCFMNSILQCILSTDMLVGYFFLGAYKKDINKRSPMKGQLAIAFANLVNEAMKHYGLSKSIAPSQFKRQIEQWAPQFAGYNQQDSQEFLRFMLDGLHEDLNRVQVRPKFTYKDSDVDVLSSSDKATLSWNRYHAVSSSLVFDLFGGQLQSTVKCLGCGAQSTTFDMFWDLSLPIPKVYQRSRLENMGTKSQQCSIVECLAEFALEELLDELYQCDACKSRQKASKCLRIHRCPEILVLHLKRFLFTAYSRDKIETNVQYPIRNLSLEPIMSGTPGRDHLTYYDLFGVSNHMGGMGGGHYIAHCKNSDDGQWYQRNDSRVSSCSELALTQMGSSAYVLFFQKKRNVPA
ncbi:hypothetical protein DFJ73DRAFT_811732, partial [Zopfochytrium polystomum]